MADDTSPLITGKDQLIAFHASGARTPEQWRIGTEHEKFGFRLNDLRPPTFDGEHGIEALLKGLTRFGWQPVEENGRIIALLRDDASVTLEPAGQFELSGAQLENVHQTCKETNQHLSEVKTVADELGIGFLGMGFQPKWQREDMPWMPKGRYKIMRDYMPKVGTLGLDMMTRTCTVQVNLDFESEADMIKKFRVSLALQPIATALFADSPFTEGKPNGYLSYRSHIWTDTDPDRTGMLDFVFEDGFGFERYVDYLLDVPMYFTYRDKRVHRLRRPELPRFPERQAAGVARRAADHERLVRSHDHRVSGSAAEEIPGNARCRRRPVEPPVRAAGILGRPAVRRRTRWMRPGIWSRISAWKNAISSARWRAEVRPEAAVPPAQRARIGHRSPENLRTGPEKPPPSEPPWR